MGKGTRNKRGKTAKQIVNKAMRDTGKPKTGGRGAKQKGDRFERECVKLLNEGGIYAERVPLSGAVGGSFSSDIEVHILDKYPHDAKKKFECKSRARAWSDLYGWLKGNFGLFIRKDRSEPLIVLPISTFIRLHGTEW